jgi:hypothetical protein
MRIFFNILCPVCQKLFALISPFVDFEEKKYESAGEKHLSEYHLDTMFNIYTKVQ